MDLGLKNKIVLAAGASKGIGWATARTVLEEGARVALVARSADALADAARDLDALNTGGEVVPIAADLGTADGVNTAVQSCRERLGEPDILVNCVGSAPPGGLEDLSDEQWQAAIDGKLMPAIRLCRELLPAMKDRGSGTIVMVAGLAGIEPQAKALTLGVVNAAVLNLTTALARDVADHGVRINAVLPGPTRTGRFEFLQQARANREGLSFDEVVATVSATIPSGRPSEPEEVASLITYLISGQASQINGSAIAVDGAQLRSVR